MTRDFCTFHPTRPAIWHCDECARHFCSQCVVVIGDHPQTNPRCPLCDNSLAYLGSGNNARPFWSVADRFFVYPFSTSGLAFMALVGVLGFAMPFGFLGLFALLFTVAAAVKYCFAVLESVAMGSMAAPSLAEAISGDEDHLFLKLVGMLIVFAFIQAVAEILINPWAGSLCAGLFALILPAMIMLLAVTRELAQALSPARNLGLVASVGWPYLLAVFLTNVISTGPYLAVELFAEDLVASMIGLPILAIVIAYVAVVNFAMLGYLVFEHQGSLGFTAGDPDEERLPPTTDNRRKQVIGAINVLAQEGRHREALQQFDRRRSDFADDMVYHQRYFDFAREHNDAQALAGVADPYLELLVGRGATDHALDVWREIAAIAKTCKPRNPAIAHSLAKAAYARNLLREGLGLLVNLHKRAPGYPDLGAAYDLAATILRDLGETSKATQIEEFMHAFLRRRAVQQPQTVPGKRAASSVR